MRFDEYRARDAIGLADLVRRGEVSSAEVLEAALARLAEVNPTLNAVILDRASEARESVTAGLPDGPLSGAPFLIKDVTVAMRGTPTGAGSQVFANTPPASRDSALVAAYRQAGLVLMGKTNTPELGLACVTEPVVRGPTRNPWRLDRTPGGSSGGAAAAVAAGIVPAAHASDGGGSIRIPASCCGLFGLKPSRGRVSLAPAGEGWGGLSVQHAVTRSVRDSAALLDIASRPQPGDPYWLSPPASTFRDLAGRDPGRLRIAFSTQALSWPGLDRQCVDAVRDAARLCADLGHDVEERDPDLDFGAMAAAGGVLVQASVAATLDAEAARRGRPVTPDEVEAVTWLIYEAGRAVTGAQYVQAQGAAHAFGRSIAAQYEAYDVLLLSTLGQPPVPIGHINTNAEDLSDYAERLYSFMPNTQAFNVSGQPAMTAPLAWSEDGLPIGVQFVGRTGEEAVLLQLATQLETARPWFGRTPP